MSQNISGKSDIDSEHITKCFTSKNLGKEEAALA